MADELLELTQRATELSQWMDHGGRSRRGYYLSVKLKEMVDELPEGSRPPDPTTETLSRFLRGYSPWKAAIAIFDGELIDDQEFTRNIPATGRIVAPYLPGFGTPSGQVGDD